MSKEQKQLVKIYVSPEIKTWIEEQAELWGMSNSTFCNMCIANYKQQNEVMQVMSQMKTMIEDLSELKSKSEK